MPWGFKVYDSSGNVVCDGTSQMLRLHANGSSGVNKNSTWDFSYSALNHEPVFCFSCDPITEDFDISHLTSGGNWVGVRVTNRDSSFAVNSTFYIFVYRRK